MDVKSGNGAFMATQEAAHELADSIVRVASGAGVRTTALITDMNQVLGHSAGHATEMREAVDYLTGKRREARLDAVTRALVTEMLMSGGLCKSAQEAAGKIETALTSGRAAEVFARMVAALGGPADFLEHADRHLAKAPIVKPCLPERPGHITAMDTRAIGVALIDLGGGRRTTQDKIDHRVGFSEFQAIGAEVGPDRPICLIHAADENSWNRAAAAIRAAVKIGENAPVRHSPILDRIALD
jgi:thymidine phosphorylase